jgi:hypothetical protein
LGHHCYENSRIYVFRNKIALEAFERALDVCWFWAINPASFIHATNDEGAASDQNWHFFLRTT